MRSNFRVVLCLTLVLHLTAWATAQDAMPWARSLEEAQQIAAQQNRLVLVHFWADDCPPCKKLEQNIFPDPNFGRAVSTNYIPVKINAKEHPELARRFKVDRWPVDVVITPSGEQLTKPAVSPQDPTKYLASLDQVAAAHRVQPHAATQLAQNAANMYPAREVQYTQSVDNAAPNRQDPYAGARAPAASQMPAASPATGGYRSAPGTQAWSPEQANAQPGGQANGPAPYGAPVDPRAATLPAGAQPAAGPRGGYDTYAYPPRDNVNMKSAYRPDLPTAGGAYVEGTPYRDPRAEASHPAPSQDPRAMPGSDVAMPPMEVGQPPQNAANSAPYGQSGAGAYGASRGAEFVQGEQPRRDVRLNDNPYGQVPQQPVMQPSPNESRPQMQENPLVQAGRPAADMNARGPAPATGAAGMPSDMPPLGLEGFCPVAVIEALAMGQADSTAWVKGDVRYGAIHRGRTYLFANAAHQQKFMANPDKFSPMLSGYDPVKFAEGGGLVDGKRKFGAMHEGQMFLFVDEASLIRFEKQPQTYMNPVRQAMQQNAGASQRR